MPESSAPFTPAALTFLRQLRRNNRREWFQPRKAEFDQLLHRPLLELTAGVSDDLRAFAVDHVRPAAKAVLRIYRDVRFSKDKSPYKTHVAAMFPRAGLGKTTGAGYYFGISPDGVEVAAGLYGPGPAEARAVRAAIDADVAGWEALLSARPLARLMGPCQGEQLVRVPKPYPADHPAAELLRRKQWYFYALLDAAAATRPGLRKSIVERFRAAAGAVDRLNQAVLSVTRAADEDDDGAAAVPRRPAPMF